MRTFRLKRPIVFLDLETTGTNPMLDRIVEIAMIKVHPDGKREVFHARVNPLVPIPPLATSIHGISDADVRNERSFRELAPAVLEFMRDCDLGGFNVVRFDLPLLAEEYKRAGLAWSITDESVVDAQVIFHKMEPRTLEAAVRFYCQRNHDSAHSALGDVEATIDVLGAQLLRYENLPVEVEQLGVFCDQKKPEFVDRFGKFIWKNGEACVNFGSQHRGKPLRKVAEADPGFLDWIARKDFSAEVKQIAANAALGIFPEPPKEPSSPAAIEPEDAIAEEAESAPPPRADNRQPLLWPE